MTKEVSGAKENNTDANWDLFKEIRGTRGTKFAGEIKGFFPLFSHLFISIKDNWPCKVHIRTTGNGVHHGGRGEMCASQKQHKRGKTEMKICFHNILYVKGHNVHE